jgi:hypothetical protein
MEFPSRAVLHCLQPADHRLDAGANLLILVQQRSAFRGERLVSLAQRAVLFLEVFDSGDELFDALCKSHQLEIELRFCCIAHAEAL